MVSAGEGCVKVNTQKKNSEVVLRGADRQRAHTAAYSPTQSRQFPLTQMAHNPISDASAVEAPMARPGPNLRPEGLDGERYGDSECHLSMLFGFGTLSSTKNEGRRQG